MRSGSGTGVIALSLLLTLAACAEPASAAAPAEPAPPTPVAPAPPAATPALAPPLVERARAYLGRPYAFGGRGENLDCMGLVFLAWEDAGRGRWRKLSVNPTTLVSRASLGQPVPAVSPAAAAGLDLGALAPGDVLFFLGYEENPAEPALATLAEGEAWVWHMGMYSGGGDFIVGDHYAGRVVEEPLLPYLARHENYAGVYAVRPP
jgi:cell wall-associated NlpC family hydrolase